MVNIIGILGSLILVIGAGWPESKNPPLKSTKDWLFAIGGAVMLLYAILNYMAGGAVFFVFLEIIIVVASIMMMIDIDDRIDFAVIGSSGLLFVAWSLYLFEGYNTIIFILGLSGVGLGYAFKGGSVRRMVALTLGSVLIAIFSFIQVDWIFFWLNTFFAILSGGYLIEGLMKKK